MKDRHYQTLQDALDALPQYGADAGAWAGIERAMTPLLAERLPAYRPPAEVWNGLSRRLDTANQPDTANQHNTPAPAPGTGRHRTATGRRLRARTAVAASLAVMLSVGFALVGGYRTGPTVTYAFHREPAPAPIVEDWTWEDDNFATTFAEIEARDEPALNTLHRELTELTEASQEVQAILSAYGNDPRVVRRLAEIERDRSDIYRRIIVSL